MGTVSRIRQTAAPGAGSLRNSSRDTETSAASTDGRDHEVSQNSVLVAGVDLLCQGDDGPRAVESLAVEVSVVIAARGDCHGGQTESFSNRLRESSGSRWTGRPTVSTTPPAQCLFHTNWCVDSIVPSLQSSQGMGRWGRLPAMTGLSWVVIRDILGSIRVL